MLALFSWATVTLKKPREGTDLGPSTRAVSSVHSPEDTEVKPIAIVGQLYLGAWPEG